MMRRKVVTVAVLFVLAALCGVVAGSQDAPLLGLCGDGSRHGIEVDSGQPCGAGGEGRNPVQMLSLHTDTLIQARYAHTLVSTKVRNFAFSTQSYTFDFVIPANSMVTGFSIELDGEVFQAHPMEKQDIKIETATTTSAAVSVRDAVTFNTTLTLEPRVEIIFKLMYEELLVRELGVYTNKVHLSPSEVVEDLQVRVHISESTPLSSVDVLPFSNDVARSNMSVTVTRTSSTEAEIVFNPTISDQQTMSGALGIDSKQGLNGYVAVSYDVLRYPTGGDIIVKDNHFVHFFAPTNLTQIPKHAIFVLDVSGSMAGTKIGQLQDAMVSILSELNSNDYFTVLEFASKYRIWNLDTSWHSEDCTIYPATPNMIQKAQTLAKQMVANGDTAIHDSVLKALQCAKTGSSNSSTDELEPILLFLTDGVPSYYSTSDIQADVTNANSFNGSAFTSIYTIAFGSDADADFLRVLAQSNGGDARVVYEAEDASEQMKDVYRKISSPLLKDVTVSFDYKTVDQPSLTQSTFRTFFRGAELVVAGRLAPGASTLTGLVNAIGARNTPTSYEIRSANLSHWQPDLLEGEPALERLWAYLKLTQNLDAEILGDYTKSNASVELALEYSFVTPITCLVINWWSPETTTSMSTTTTSMSTATTSMSNTTTSMSTTTTTMTPPTTNMTTTSPASTSASTETSPTLSSSTASSTTDHPGPGPSSSTVTVSTPWPPGPGRPGLVNQINIGTINIGSISINGPLV